jgi:hypothetical protein
MRVPSEPRRIGEKNREEPDNREQRPSFSHDPHPHAREKDEDAHFLDAGDVLK